tara:strand:+ start:2345 stop:3031 length:687 start_codon:yes stop_codon:yes gene_type:complete
MFEKDIDKIIEIIESKSTLVFDFDGVIADSVNIKTWAFGELYKEYGETISIKVIDHHLVNGGMSRFEKFKHYHQKFLNKEISKSEMSNLCEQFSDMVKNAVIKSPEIKGANKFIENCHKINKMLFINSATPHDEIIEITRGRNIEKFFLSIYGSPSTKLDNLRTIFSGYNISPDQTVFFGDALADFIAARDAGCDFIGIGKDIKNVLPEIKRNSERNYGLLNNFEPLL